MGKVTEPLNPTMFDPACPSSAMPIRIGDKWAGLVICCLEDGPRRFSEIQVPLKGATPKVLTQTLRALERDGMVTRTPYAVIPPRVEYELTPLGRTLLAPIRACRIWAAEHLPTLLAARKEWEQRASNTQPTSTSNRPSTAAS